MMPNKTIYVAETDLPIFDRAQELAGSNLSSVIARALRLYVQTEEAKANDLRDVTVKVGEDGNVTRKQFRGKLLAKWNKHTADDRFTCQIVYHTAKGKLALYSKSIPHWSRYNDRDWEAWDWSTGDYTLLVFDTLDALQSHISPEFFQRVARALRGEDQSVETLDI